MFVNGKGGEGHVIDDADGEMAFGFGQTKVCEDVPGHGRCEILGSETVPASHDGPVIVSLLEHTKHVEVEGFSKGSILLGPVQDRDPPGRGRNRVVQMFGGEWSVQPNLHQSDLLTTSHQIIHGLLSGLGTGSHHDDDPLGLRVTHIIEEIVPPTREREDLLHLLLHNAWYCLVEAVCGFIDLEVDVRVLGRSTQMGMFRIQRAVPVPLHAVPVHQRHYILVIDHLDLLDLV